MNILLWSLFGFLLGSIPFSVWIGNMVLKKDIRQEGDHNPGATNVLRAGNAGWYVIALILDISKGALPVGLATYVVGINGWSLLPIALAPPMGHAFSPFLGFRGGKAVAASLGIWIGLTLWRIPLVALLLVTIFSLLVKPSGWAVLLTLIGMGVAIWLWLPDPVLLGVLLANALLLVYTHRDDLQQRPRLRSL
ncbi:glycerol-3-phosphate acyltransferase [Chloroflexota bacterium]